MNDLGLEYKYLARFLQEKISREKMEEEIAFKDWQYAKRQLTWLRADKKIEWFSLNDTEKVFERVKEYLSA
jgi:tRNA dimethylallyltransferase